MYYSIRVNQGLNYQDLICVVKVIRQRLNLSLVLLNFNEKGLGTFNLFCCKILQVHLLGIFIYLILFSFVSRKKKNPTDVGKRLCIAPEITILCKVQKHTVPFHMFLPVRLGLYPLSQTYMDCSDVLQFSNNQINKICAESKLKSVFLISSRLKIIIFFLHLQTGQFRKLKSDLKISWLLGDQDSVGKWYK